MALQCEQAGKARVGIVQTGRNVVASDCSRDVMTFWADVLQGM